MEMLLVLLVAGLLAAVVVPGIGGGLAGTRAQIAARGLAQMSRYARNMALANQTEVELVIVSNGVIRVRASSGSVNFANRGQPRDEGDLYGGAAMERARGMAGGGAPDFMMGEGGASARQASTASLESTIAQEKKFENVSFEFEGYTDGTGRLLSEREGGGKGRAEGGEGVVRFHSNGTCKPCRFRVVAPHGAALVVNLAMTGKAAVEVEQ